MASHRRRRAADQEARDLTSTDCVRHRTEGTRAGPSWSWAITFFRFRAHCRWQNVLRSGEAEQHRVLRDPQGCGRGGDSFQAFGLEEPHRAMSTLSEQHRVIYTARSVRAKNDQEIWNSGLIKSMKGTPWAPRREDSQAEVWMPEERHKHQHENVS